MLQSVSGVWLFVTSCTLARQTPLSVEFSRQGSWRGRKGALQASDISSWLCCPLAALSWANPLTSLGLNFLSCKNEEIWARWSLQHPPVQVFSDHNYISVPLEIFGNEFSWPIYSRAQTCNTLSELPQGCCGKWLRQPFPKWGGQGTRVSSVWSEGLRLWGPLGPSSIQPPVCESPEFSALSNYFLCKMWVGVRKVCTKHFQWFLRYKSNEKIY